MFVVMFCSLQETFTDFDEYNCCLPVLNICLAFIDQLKFLFMSVEVLMPVLLS